MCAIPAPSRFLGIMIDDTVPSDLRYAFELLESKDPKAFFNGLKILVSIFISNETKSKREWAEKILSMLCRVIPSYVKKKDDIYELNITKIDDTIKQGKHPLDLKRTLETARRTFQANPSSNDNSEFVTEQPTGIIMTAPPDTQDDDIRIISIEDQGEEEKRIKANVIADLTAAGEENVDEVPELEPVHDNARVSADSQAMNIASNSVVNKVKNEEDESVEKSESLVFEEPKIDADADDEWVSANDFKSWIDEKVIYDEDGKASKEFERGLNLMNPVDHEAEIDMNYSSSKGYHDIYRPRQEYPSQSSAPAPSFPNYETDESMSCDTISVEIKTGVEVGNQECGFGDGSIDPTETNVYVCPGCQTPFHNGCGKMVLELQGGHCPVCNHPW